MNRFSAFERENILRRLKKNYYDLLVIGGGITGAGIALDAASRGLKTALIEKNDFASGTSSRSTKLIHGGLRYLKQFEIALVREVGTERAIVHDLAPHLVTPEKMLLPIIEDGTFGKLLTSFGLMIYDVLAGVEKEDQRKMLSKEETLALEPLLPPEILKGSGLYAEYRTDDARLTVEVLKTASEHEADILNYVAASDFQYENKLVTGIKAHDELSGEDFEIAAKYVVSAAGPWVDELRDVDHSKKGKRLHLTKGVHIVFPHHKLPVKHSIYFDVPDGRMIFAIPRGKITYVGTTDTEFTGDKNHIITELKDAKYLVEAVNNMFPAINLDVSDIVSSWAGVRPLIHEEGKSTSELSRKDEIFESPSGLISIAGGKLTGYRKMAQRVVDLITDKFEDEYGKNFTRCYTDKIILSGGIFNDAKDVMSYTQKIYNKIKGFEFDHFDANYLVRNYGKQSDTILAKFMSMQEKDHEIRLVKAELWFAINYELTFNPCDFLIRRTGKLYFSIKDLTPLIEPVIQEFVSYFNWDDEKVRTERQLIHKAIEEVTQFNTQESQASQQQQ